MPLILFSIVIDLLLRNLEATGQGLSVCALNIGASVHAHDVHAISNLLKAAEIQGNCHIAFCNANSLKLNSTNTDAVVFTYIFHEVHVINLAGHSTHSHAQTVLEYG